MYQLFKAKNIKEWIVLYSESTATIFCNPEMVKDIQQQKRMTD
jgi:hypothetical protein